MSTNNSDQEYHRGETALVSAGLIVGGAATIFVNPLALPWILTGIGGLGFAALVPDKQGDS